MKRKNLSRLLSILGVLLILGAAALTAYNFHTENQAELAASDTLESLVQQIPGQSADELNQNSGLDDLPLPEALHLHELFPYMDMPEQEIDGKMYVGVLEIPALNLTLPILSQWSTTDSRIAPCRYVGSAYMDDLVIAGHNYRTHFGRIRRLSVGDQAIFTDVDGNVFVYEMAYMETLRGNQVEQMISGDDWDLTLFTCTLDSQDRITVRFAQVTE